MMSEVLDIRDLWVKFYTREGTVNAVNGVTLTLHEKEVLAIVGESGSGKTVTALSILGLVPYPGEAVHAGIFFNGVSLDTKNEDAMRLIRGNEISMVFQNAAASLNPTLSISTQMQESLLAHQNISSQSARRISGNLLAEMGLSDPFHVMNQYPFQISGGMAERVMIAMALASRPKVLIADEATSNLDVTIQAEILDRLRLMQKEQGAAIILITHDMGVVANLAHRVAVMYAGRLMEIGTVESVFRSPTHPYTWGLVQALPRLDKIVSRPRPIPGMPPNLMELPDKCPFLPRCHKATVECRIGDAPELRTVAPGHLAACYNPMANH
ncbi:ABC transporter ATP-binding protein [SAR202 cluster bacterium AD-802-E10_MRT_200m]|nr:ABC transporter ATP-binding protein [SAR202 cluster bacterium AD-802-E10_MRT_200m]